MTKLSRRDRRALTAGLAVIGAALVWTHGWPRYRTWASEAGERAWLVESQLRRLHGMLAAAPATAESLASTRERFLALAPRLLVGESSAAAGSALLALVSSAIPSGVALGSLVAMNDSVAGRHFLRVAVGGDFTSDVLGLTEFLRVVEVNPTRLVVTELAVDQAEPAAPGTQAESLQVRFVVEGVALLPRKEAER